MSPNHVKNRITVSNGVLTQFVGPNLEFDFRLFIPQPECISDGSVPFEVEVAARRTCGLDIICHPDRCPDPSSFTGEYLELYERYINAHQKTGYLCWHDWRNANWNTKWNSYSVEFSPERPGIITFQTAWSAPHPVVAAMAERLIVHNGAMALVHEWADEDVGRNVGRTVYIPDNNTGSTFRKETLDRTKEGYELAFDMWGRADEYHWNGTEYVYREELDR